MDDMPTDDGSARWDAQMAELLEARYSAERNNDYAASDRAGGALLNLAWERMLEAAERNEVPEDFLLKVEALDCEQNRDWNGARKAYLQVIKLAEQSSSPFAAWSAHEDLAALLWLLGEADEALCEQKSATAAARDADSDLGLRMALISEASLLLKLDDPNGAARRVTEALAVPDPEAMDELGSVKLRVLKAWCETLNGRITEARTLLNECFPYLERAGQMPSAAGIHSTLSSWWRVESKCCEMEGNSAGEVHARRSALDIARYIDEMPHAAGVYTKARVADDLDRLSEALWRNNNFEEASHLRRESRAIRTELKLPATSQPRLCSGPRD